LKKNKRHLCGVRAKETISQQEQTVMGRTAALIGEFSIKNRPVITCPCGNLEHVSILREKGIYYTSKESLLDIFRNIRTIISSRTDWNAHREYSPEKVMAHFHNIVFRHCA
jgi:hypothetical protein